MFKDTILVTLCFVLGGILGFASQLVFASTFGASAEMDLYFRILSIPTIVTGISAVIFSSVLIPMFAKFNSDEAELQRITYSIWIIILISGILFMVIGGLSSVLTIEKVIPDNTSYFRKLGVQLSLLVWVGSGFSILSGYLAAVLNYKKQFFMVAWTSLLPAVLMILVVLLFHSRFGVSSISIGFCAAFALQFILLLNASNISSNLFNFRAGGVPFKKTLLIQSILASLSLLPFTILVPIGLFWASKLETGSVSYLGYAQSFAGFLSVAVSLGISIVSFPDLAKRFANDEEDLALYQFEMTLRYVLLVAMFAAAILIVIRLPLLTFFYERGNFGPDAVKNLARVIPWYLMAAVFVAGLNLLRNLYYSRGDFNIIAVLGLMVPIIFSVLAGFLKNQYSYVGIGMANAFTFAALFFATVHFAGIREKSFLTTKFYIFILKNFIAISTAVFLSIKALPYIASIGSQLVVIAVSSVLFSFTYLAVAKYILNLTEIDKVATTVQKKMRELSPK